MPSLPSLGRMCGSSHGDDMVVLDRVKRKNSVRRMSIIEDGQVAEVLYLIPKQSMMEQLPFLNPNDYILCEKMIGVPTDAPPGKRRGWLVDLAGWGEMRGGEEMAGRPGRLGRDERRGGEVCLCGPQ